MEKQYGLLVSVDKNQVQSTNEDPQLNTCLNELHISRKLELKGDISGIFLNASGRRSHFFMNFNYMNYTRVWKNGKGRIPIYGVKGAVHEVKRATNYTAWYASKEDDLLGTEFFMHVFGTDYITEKETIILTDPLPRLQKQRSVNLTVRNEDIDTVCHIAEKLWEALERDAQTRFIILMEGAESRSMELMRELYLLLPQRLRMQLGFETNIAKMDLDIVQSSGGLPIHVFTMEKNEYRDIANAYNFPVVVYDTGNQEAYTYNTKRLWLLRRLCHQMGKITLACLSYAEGKVMKEKEQWASSFTLYEDIINRMSAPDFGWWKQGIPENIEQLYTRYQDQESLMKEPDVEGEAVRAFYMDLLQKGNYASELVQILRNPMYPNREEYLQFMRQNLYYGPQIDATEALIGEMGKEKTEALNATDTQRQQELAQMQTRLTEERNAEILMLENRHVQEKEDLKRELDQQYFVEREKTRKAHERELMQREEKLEQYESRLYSLREENQKILAQMERNRKSNAAPDAREFEELKRKVDRLNRKNEKSEDMLYSVKKVRNIFIILTCVFACVVVALSVIFAVSRLKVLKDNGDRQNGNSQQVVTEMDSVETESVTGRANEFKAQSDAAAVNRMTDEPRTQNGTAIGSRTIGETGTQNGTATGSRTIGETGTQNDVTTGNRMAGTAGTQNSTVTDSQTMGETVMQTGAATDSRTIGETGTQTGVTTANRTADTAGMQNNIVTDSQTMSGTGPQSSIAANGQIRDEIEARTAVEINSNMGTVTWTKDAQNNLVVEDSGNTYSWH